MERDDFFKWLDTIILLGDSNWELRTEFESGHVLIAFSNIVMDEADS